jgi:AcrR family transcriptional regulator
VTGRPDKRQAILDAALGEFARDGYARTSVDAIARSAGVSTRTIYAHFQGKARLFETVIQDSASRVAAVQVAIIERHLDKILDLEADLIAFGTDLTKPMTGFLDHFALVRQVNAELEHIPQPAIEAWRRAGPQRVIAALADRLRRIANRGLLALDAGDAADEPASLAAAHLMLLVQGAVPFHHGVGANDKADLGPIVRAGVRVFLHGYASTHRQGEQR